MSVNEVKAIYSHPHCSSETHAGYHGAGLWWDQCKENTGLIIWNKVFRGIVIPWLLCPWCYYWQRWMCVFIHFNLMIYTCNRQLLPLFLVNYIFRKYRFHSIVLCNRLVGDWNQYRPFQTYQVKTLKWNTYGSALVELSICTTDESRTVEWHFESCVHASTLSSVGPSNSTTRKGPDNRRGDDATFDILPSQNPSVV